jgi:hypothetical protein
MPVHQSQDDDGPYYQWGKHGKKYYYKKNSKTSEINAHKKASTQGRAILMSERMHGWGGGDYQTYGQSWVNF